MRNISAFIILLLFWIALTFSFRPVNLAVGAVAAFITIALFGRYFVTDPGKMFQLQRYFWFVIFLLILLWECIKANFDVAYRVLSPSMPIKPGIVKIPLGIKTDLARTILANSITMTPGTISVDIVDNFLYVHWIYVRSNNPDAWRGHITEKFEKYIKRIFD